MIGPDEHFVLCSGIGDRIARRQKVVQNRQHFPAVAVRRNGFQIGNRVRTCAFANTGWISFISMGTRSARCRRSSPPAKSPAACAAPRAEAWLTSRPIWTSPAAKPCPQRAESANECREAAPWASALPRRKFALGNALTFVSCCNSQRFRGMDGGQLRRGGSRSPRLRFLA